MLSEIVSSLLVWEDYLDKEIVFSEVSGKIKWGLECRLSCIDTCQKALKSSSSCSLVCPMSLVLVFPQAVRP